MVVFQIWTFSCPRELSFIKTNRLHLFVIGPMNILVVGINMVGRIISFTRKTFVFA